MSESKGKPRKGGKVAQAAKLDKREVRRQTAQRRVGLGEEDFAQYSHVDAEVKTRKDDSSESSRGEPEESQDEEDGIAEEDVKSSWKPSTSSTSAREATIDKEEDEEIKDIKSGIRAQLLSWAKDPGMPLEEQKRMVRQLLAQWHPDKNRHIGPTATRIFQFIQEEVERIVSQLEAESDLVAKKAMEAQERKAQRFAERSAKTSALEAARKEKREKRGEEPEPKKVQEAAETEAAPQEWSLVIGHGQATTSFLRPWPRSHFTITSSHLPDRGHEILIFGGEAYDGCELTFYSDLYRLDMGSVDTDTPLPWEKLYSAVPTIPGPEARSAHQAFCWEGFLYVFGGEWSSRDQKRYRQFRDLWRFDARAMPGTRWEHLEAAGAVPEQHSGHRMAIAGSYGVLFGGFTEDKKRRPTYLDDFYALHLPSHTWRLLPTSSDRRARPVSRSGGLLFAAATSVFIYGGSRPTRKGGDSLQVLEDLWRARLGSDGGALWEQLTAEGEGPGRRSGLCHCPLLPDEPLRRLVFGGVADHRVASSSSDGTKRAAEVAVFHQDIFLLDCTGTPRWTRLWPRPGTQPVAAPQAAVLPEDLLMCGGGADAQCLALAVHQGAKAKSGEAARQAPRGRMAAGCMVAQGSFWVFGGSCESGPKQEVTLDDLWRIPLTRKDKDVVECGDQWECVLPLSDRATIWFESSDSEDEDWEEPGRPHPDGTLVEVKNPGGGVLSKKQQKEEAKRARMEIKRERQAEKCEEKTTKKELKKERQRQQAKQQ